MFPLMNRDLQLLVGLCHKNQIRIKAQHVVANMTLNDLAEWLQGKCTVVIDDSGNIKEMTVLTNEGPSQALPHQHVVIRPYVTFEVYPIPLWEFRDTYLCLPSEGSGEYIKRKIFCSYVQIIRGTNDDVSPDNQWPDWLWAAWLNGQVAFNPDPAEKDFITVWNPGTSPLKCGDHYRLVLQKNGKISPVAPDIFPTSYTLVSMSDRLKA